MRSTLAHLDKSGSRRRGEPKAGGAVNEIFSVLFGMIFLFEFIKLFKWIILRSQKSGTYYPLRLFYHFLTKQLAISVVVSCHEFRLHNDFAESLLTRGLSPLPVCVLDNEQLKTEISTHNQTLENLLIPDRVMDNRHPPTFTHLD